MDSPRSVQVVKAPRERWGSALNLVLSQRPFAERARLAENLARPNHSRKAGAGFDGLFEARCQDSTVGAALAVLQTGRTALTYQPRITSASFAAAIGPLNEAMAAYLRQHNVCLAQEVLPLAAAEDAALARSYGYNIQVELTYLAADAVTFPETPPTDLCFEAYQPGLHLRFADLLSRSFELTLDCPEINGVRSCLESLESYRQTGCSGTDLWGILSCDGRDVGCLVVTRHADQTAELIYLGLVLEARGRGWSRSAIAWAKWLARSARCSLISAAADQRNTPALRAYTATGFIPFDARRVMLRIMTPMAAS